MKKLWLFLFTIMFISLAFASDFGYNNPTLPNVPSPEKKVITTTININNTNSSDYWDNMNTINATQMEDSGGVLTILENWFSTLFDALFGAKSTDDLTQGSINFYDN